jgi:putative restriction endonuclease
MGVLSAVLPGKYSPLQASGNGNQGIYLTELSAQFAQTLIGLIGRQAQELTTPEQKQALQRPAAETADMKLWEHHLEQTIEESEEIPETERQSLIVARRGQGLFKERVMQIESYCRVTKVEKLEHLRASHCKPWRDSNNDERLNGENLPSFCGLIKAGFSHRSILKTSLTYWPFSYVRSGPKKCDEVRGKSKYEC